MAYKFVNPYNFIPAAREKSKEDKQEGYSGVITYSVLTKTPLFIPNTSNDKIFCAEGEAAEHRSYDFYSYNNLEGKTFGDGKKIPSYAPVIPGSEIRGMFRSNFEILTNSCFSALDGEKSVLSKRTMTSYSPGLLHYEDGRIVLYEAEDVLWRTKGEKSDTDEERSWEENKCKPEFFARKCFRQEQYCEGEEVSFEYYSRKGKGKALAKNVRKMDDDRKRTECGAEIRTGYIIKGSEGPDFTEAHEKAPFKVQPQKHCCHIFTMPQQEKKVQKERIQELSNVDFDKLKKLLKIFEKNKKEEHIGYAEYETELEKFRKGEGNAYFPIYYSKIYDRDKNKSILLLSPACKTREIYDVSIADMNGVFKPCDNLSDLCEACALFGTVIKGGQGRVSKLRFTDLEMKNKKDGKSPYMERGLVTLHPLSSPKLSNTEFYLKRPQDSVFWSYEYYVDSNHKLHIANGEVAGRKFYWHFLGEADYKDQTRSSQNMTVRPVRKGVEFVGKIYFDNVSEKELKKLLYVINAGDKGDLENKQHGYKLGAAKPLGFGSVACSVTSVLIKSYMKSGQTVLKILKSCNHFIDECYDTSLFDESVCRSYNVMTDFKALSSYRSGSGKGEYSYPRMKEKGDVFEWFSGNHKGLVYSSSAGKYNESSSPNKREDLLICEYMQAMKPELQKTLAIAASLDERGKILTAKVTGYNDKKTIVFLRTGDKNIRMHITKIAKGKGRIALEKELPIGSKVRVRDNGYNANGYPDFDFVEKL